MKRSKSSRQWLDRHFKDEYVQKSHKDGFRSRAAYKLQEIQERDRLIKPSHLVVDLGAAPGGWSQYARRLVGGNGGVVALDILPMDPIDGVSFIQGDFREESVLAQLQRLLDGSEVDLVISDMAPNVTGMAVVDQPRSMYLCELALDFTRNCLKPGGSMVVKVFQGEGFDQYMRDLRAVFNKVVARKPKASRPKSREVYLVATGFKG